MSIEPVVRQTTISLWAATLCRERGFPKCGLQVYFAAWPGGLP